jgi:hypothetical protein
MDDAQREKNINPFSHRGFCVSRLTAVGHMRYPKKDDIGENDDDSSVCVCV